jgi:hypothetical protein
VTWSSYLGILRRRWWIVVAIVVLDLLVSAYLYRKADTQAGSQSCFTLYVADVSSPSLIAAPQTTLETAGQLLAGETAANFFADDILDVAQSRSVAAYMQRHAPASTGAGFVGNVSGSRKDRTVDLCVTAPQAATAQTGAVALSRAMTVDRSQFVGRNMAKRTFVNVISSPEVSPVPTTHALNSLVLRVGLGVLVALAAALFWDALDPARAPPEG